MATALTRQAVADGWPVVIAVGGDGTVNEVVNGLTDPSGRPLGTLAVVVTGRGRDICRNMGVASDPEIGARRLIDGAEIEMDLGVAEWKDGHRRYFVNAAGIGFDAAVAQRARVGRGPGTVPYLVAVLRTLGAYAPFSASVSLDGEPVSAGPFATIVTANGAHYGGGMKIAPAANPADGLIDLVILGDLGRIELVRWLPTVYRGKHLANPKVTARTGRTVDIDAARPADASRWRGRGVPTGPDQRLSPSPPPAPLRRPPGVFGRVAHPRTMNASGGRVSRTAAPMARVSGDGSPTRARTRCPPAISTLTSVCAPR